MYRASASDAAHHSVVRILLYTIACEYRDAVAIEILLTFLHWVQEFSTVLFVYKYWPKFQSYGVFTLLISPTWKKCLDKLCSLVWLAIDQPKINLVPCLCFQTKFFLLNFLNVSVYIKLPWWAVLNTHPPPSPHEWCYFLLVPFWVATKTHITGTTGCVLVVNANAGFCYQYV